MNAAAVHSITSPGGAGTFDSIFLIGIVAVYQDVRAATRCYDLVIAMFAARSRIRSFAGGLQSVAEFDCDLQAV